MFNPHKSNLGVMAAYRSELNVLQENWKMSSGFLKHKACSGAQCVNYLAYSLCKHNLFSPYFSVGLTKLKTLTWKDKMVTFLLLNITMDIAYSYGRIKHGRNHFNAKLDFTER